MGKNEILHYYVEGETEKKIIDALKTEYRSIKSGKVEKFTITNKLITYNRIRALKKGTTVVLVFDTDIESSDVLDSNILFLKKQKNIGKVLCITQVDNLEDELKRSCNINQIKDLTGSKSNSDFKRDILKQGNIRYKLDKGGFDVAKLWICCAKKPFQHINNDADKIRC